VTGGDERAQRRCRIGEGGGNGGTIEERGSVEWIRGGGGGRGDDEREKFLLRGGF
jgi:hypothetical protein